MSMTISSGMRILNQAYLSYAINYPRVSNDYSPPFAGENSYPHKKITFDRQAGFKNSNFSEEYLEPLLFPFYDLDKDTSILYLTNKGIVTPSTIVNVYDYLNKFYTDDLEVRKLMRETKKNTLSKFFSHLEELEERYGNAIKDDTDGNINVNRIAPDGIVSSAQFIYDGYKVPTAPTPTRRDNVDRKMKLLKERNQVKKKHSYNNFEEEDLPLKKENSFYDALALHKKKRKLFKAINGINEYLNKKNKNKIVDVNMDNEYHDSENMDESNEYKIDDLFCSIEATINSDVKVA